MYMMIVNDELQIWRIHPAPAIALNVSVPTSIGRNPACDIHLPEDAVSRLHASLEERDGSLRVLDQGSRNGVYVGGCRVGSQRLEVGSVVRIGDSVLWAGPKEAARDRIERVVEDKSQSLTPLLITGPGGSGKRTVARELHRRAGRQGEPITVSKTVPEALLSALPDATIIVEEPDSFDALAARASGHSVLLLGIAVQSAGESADKLMLPPLRDRMSELPDVLDRILEAKEERTWDADFIEALACHHYVLNFAELEAVCRPLIELAGSLRLEHLPHSVKAEVVEARNATVEDLSRERLDDALTRHRGNVRRIAQELGIGRGQLYRLLAGFGLNPDLYRGLSSPMDPQPREREERRTQP